MNAATCTCRGYDPADPCGHGDTSEGCPAHDSSVHVKRCTHCGVNTPHHHLTFEDEDFIWPGSTNGNAWECLDCGTTWQGLSFLGRED